MAEYIDREAFIEDIKTEIVNLSLDGMKGTPRPHDELYSFIERIEEQPAADVAPVVHGRWEEYGGEDFGLHYCSVCKGQAFNYEDERQVIEVLSNYCPNCGAKMDE